MPKAYRSFPHPSTGRRGWEVAAPDTVPGNAQCEKYASDAAYCYCDAIYPEYACGRCGEVWGTSAGIIERQTHEKLYYHFENGMCKSWYCKNCHTYSWK